MRYPHYLRDAAGGRWPKRVLVVDCESRLAIDDTTATKQQDRLYRWHMACMLLAGDLYGLHWTMSGDKAADFWLCLQDQLQDKRPTWLLSESCGRTWPLLELWRNIENGTVEIGLGKHNRPTNRVVIAGIRATQRDMLSPVSSGARNRATERAAGALVCGDPPNIIDGARVCGASCSITWVDARNYAVALPDTIERGMASVAWLVKFWRDYHMLCASANLGSAKTTTGSQALHGWRVGYYTGGVYAGGTQEVEQRERSALIGGRCEVFRMGAISGPIYHLDIRSAYASQCVKESVPIRIIGTRTNVPVEEMYLYPTRWHKIASVRIRTDERAYPCRRSRFGSETAATPSGNPSASQMGGDGDIIWPVGEYDTVLCGPELADAFTHGRIVKCYALHEYDCSPILRGYAESVYHHREMYESVQNKEMATVCKALLTSIVGKFGQRDRHWQHCPDMWSPQQYGEWYGADEVGRGCRYRSLGGYIQRDVIGGLASEAVPAVAAWILSAARMQLLRLIRIAGWESVYYCDTDAIMVDEAGFLRLLAADVIHQKALGALQVHGIYQSVDIRGLKWYSADGRVTCSGVPRGRCVDAGDGVHYWYSAHAAVDVANHKRPESVRVLREYLRSKEYHHGVVRSDGRVDPITLG